jgi:uncharacterized repeat protein (TIGR01451 family)
MRMLKNSAVVLATLITLFLPWKAGATEFGSAKTYPVGTNPVGPVFGDFNGDGKLDIAVVNIGSNNVSILLGNGDGTFQAAKNFDVGNSMTGIALGDFNGDGKLDVAVFLPGDPNTLTAGEVRILFGNGDGTLQAPKVTVLTSSAVNFAAGDFNSDKKPDLIVCNVDSSTGVSLEILIGNGDGTFQAPLAVQSVAMSTNFGVADFNKDGKPDLAIATSEGVQVLLGKGDGTFQPGSTATITNGFAVQTFLTTDVNGDGAADLIVDSRQSKSCGLGCSSTTQHVSTFLAQGNGAFGSEQIFYTGIAQRTLFSSSSSLISNVLIGDFNADGKADVGDVVKNFEVRLGDGDGSFAAPIPVVGTVCETAVHDLNGDKLADLVCLDSPNNNVLVYLNDSPTSGADLGIVSASPDGFAAGQGINLTYSADVLNEGPQGATNVVFTDTLPASATFVSATSTQGSCTQSMGIVTCDVGLLAFAADVQISIIVTPTATGTITNTMSVSAKELDLAQANNSITQTGTVVPTFKLTINKAGNGTGLVTSFVFHGQGGGIDCGSSCSALFVAGIVVHLNRTADSDSSFQGWGGACSGTSDCAVTMTSDMTVSATFTRNPQLTVKFAGGGDGIVRSTDGSLSCSNTDATCSAQYAPGTVVSLTAQASNASTFTSWSGACTGTDPTQCSITVNADATVTATFTPPPDFTINSASSTLSLSHGGQTTEVLSFGAQGGFSGSVALACSVTGPSPLLTCGLSPSSVNVGANPASSTLTITSPPQAAAGIPAPPADSTRVLSATWLTLPAAVLIGFGLLSGNANQRRRNLRLVFGLLVLVIVLQAACGGGGTGTPVPQTYTVTVTATSGAFRHSTDVSVTVK